MNVTGLAPAADPACSCGEGCGCARPPGLVEADRLARDLALERSYALLRQVDMVRDLFTRIVLRGDSMETLRSAAAELIGRDVAIDDFAADVDEPGVFAIEAADHILGTVRVTMDGGPLDDGATAIARHAAVAAAMLLLTDRSPRWPTHRHTDVPRPRILPHDDWPASWLATIPLDDRSPYVTIAMTFECDADGADPTQTHDVVRHAVDRALQGRRIPALVGSHADELVIVVPLSDRSRATSVSRSLVEQVGTFIGMAGPRYRTNIGLTNLAEGGASVGQRVDEARRAARIGRVLDGQGSVTAFEDLRAFPAMMEAVAGHGDAAFGELHERYLGSLVRYEKRTGLPLLQTLIVLFDENGNVSGAARSLRINRQSLLYRLRKIETMSSVDLGDPSDRFALELAVRSWIVRQSLAPSDEGSVPMEHLDARVPHAIVLRPLAASRPKRVGVGARAAAG